MDPRDGGALARCPACAYQFTAPRLRTGSIQGRRERFRRRLSARVRANRSRVSAASLEIGPDVRLAGRIIGGVFGTALTVGVLTLQSAGTPSENAFGEHFPAQPGLPLDPPPVPEAPADPVAEAPDNDAPPPPKTASADEMFATLAIPEDWKPAENGKGAEEELAEARDWARLADLCAFVEVHSQDKRAGFVRRVLVDDAHRLLLRQPPPEARLEKEYVAAALAAARGLAGSGYAPARETRLFVERLCRNGHSEGRTAHLQDTELANAAIFVTMELVETDNALPLPACMLLAEVLHAVAADADRVWLEERFLKDFLQIKPVQLRKRRRRVTCCGTAMDIAGRMVNDLKGDPERARQLYAVAVHCHACGDAETAERLLAMLYTHLPEGRDRRRVLEKKRCWDLKFAGRVRTRIEEQVQARCAAETPAAIEAVSPAEVARGIGLQWPVEGSAFPLDVVAGNVQRKLDADVREKFPDADLLAIRKRLDQQYRPYAIGDQVTVHLLRGRRMGVVKGTYRAAGASFVRVGSRTMSRDDLEEEDRIRFDPTKCEIRKRQLSERETGAFLRRRNLYRKKRRAELAAQFHKEAGYIERNGQWVNPSALFQANLEKTRKRVADDLRHRIERECYGAESFVWRNGAWMPADPDAK